MQYDGKLFVDTNSGARRIWLSLFRKDDNLVLVLTGVDSTAIQDLAYVPTLRKLAIRFTGGGEYVYHAVSLETFVELITAESVGQAFNKHVKNNNKREVVPSEGPLTRLVNQIFIR